MDIIAIGDIHAPWVHKPTLQFIFNLIKIVQPKYIVQVGDSVDFYSASRFPKSPFITPKEEFLNGRKALEQIFEHIKYISPSSETHLLLGNHCIRPLKSGAEKTPELLYFIEGGLKRYFTFPNVITHHDPRVPLEIDDILFMHGFMSGLGRHAESHQKKVVCGHTHKGGTWFSQTYEGRWLWELNCGYVGDPLSKVMTYTPTKYSKCTLGVGKITNGWPQFIPFIQP